MNDNLTLGSIVTLKITKDEYANSKFVIVNRFIINPQNQEEYFDYEVMLYPSGSIDGGKILINNEQVKDIEFVGYKDEFDTEFQKEIKKMLNSAGLKKAVV